MFNDKVNIVGMKAALCKEQVEQWNKGNHDTLLNFHANALLPKYMPLFKLICCQMIPSSHTSNVVVERAPLLFAIVKNMKINVGNLIMIDAEGVQAI